MDVNSLTSSHLVSAQSLSAMLDQLKERTYCVNETLIDLLDLIRGARDAHTISPEEFRILIERCARLQLALETDALQHR